MDNPANYETLSRLSKQYRNRLVDLGWFMKFLNESMARQANNENGAPVTFGKAGIDHPTSMAGSFE
ncbi:MAG: hypothetical protein ACJAYN_001690 [Bermanella sp.]